MQIIVFGMHRSGTSLITRLINMMGAYFAPEKASLGYTQDNPKGYWERRDAMHINDALLAANGCAWDRLAAWPEKPLPAPEQARAIRSLMLDMDAHRPWVLKDPRLCLTFPYWRQHLEVPVAVLAHRNPLEVAHSLARRDGMPLDYALALWEYHAAHALNATLGLPRLHAGHAEALGEPIRFVHGLKEALEHCDVRGLRTPSDREILAFVDPTLHRNKAEGGGAELSPHQQMLESMLKGNLPQTAAVAISAEAVERMRAGYSK